MSDFKRQGKFGNSRPSGGFNRGGSGRPSFNKHQGGNRERSQMYPATCSNCHKECEVPFRPNGSKPVYCKDCFSSMRDEPVRRNDSSSFSHTKSFASTSANPQPGLRLEDLKKQVDGMNGKLDKIIQLLGASATIVGEQKPEDREGEEMDELSFNLPEEKQSARPVLKKEKTVVKRKPAKRK